MLGILGDVKMDFYSFPYASSFSLTVNSCGADDAPFGNASFGPVLTRSTLIQYCHCGEGYFEINGNRFNVSKGDCIISFDGELRTEVVEDDPWCFSWLYLSGKTVDEFLSKLNITPENPVIHGCKESRIPALFKEMIHTADAHGNFRDILLAGKIFEFFAELSYVQNSSADAELLQQDEYVSRAIYYMNMHYMEKELRIESIAKNIGLNRSYLYEIFKEKTGLSPQEYLARLRIKSACDLLKLPQASVATVAHSVGYEPLVFSRTFKKIMGIIPSEYMKNRL